ncbi:MAG TPA: citrate synthase family protein [Candidatus Kapabacteria bacterium]|nr:citrate synthase family protein [Candidatus Kapabacteria bacterium]
MSDHRFYSAREAAALLGISAATLYAYVSRGMVRSEEIPGERRARRYRAEDIDRMRERRQLRNDPARAAREALRWGEPVLESGISLIEGGRLYYRGQLVTELAGSASVEEVAGLIWRGLLGTPVDFDDPSTTLAPSGWRKVMRALPEISALERAQMALPLAELDDHEAFILDRPSIERGGARIVRTMLAVAAGADRMNGGVARTLAAHWTSGRRQEIDLVSAALVLTCDHELNVSAFTVRCVASAGSTPYAAVAAGLGALRGTRHGGQTEKVARLVDEVERCGSARTAIAARRRQGDEIPGFNHPLYPSGDPRGAMLLELAAAVRGTTRALRPVHDLVREMQRSGSHPTLDIGLVALARALRLGADAPIVLFALGRAIGWIGHAIEQYPSGQLIRPRARYAPMTPDDNRVATAGRDDELTG